MRTRTGTARPGGRTARTTEAVHAAVRGLLEESGSAGVQVADVAARAGVNATTVYRRWGSVDALLLEVAVADLNRDRPLPSTGDLRDDLLAYARQVRADVEAPGGLGLLHAIIAAAANPAVGPSGAAAMLQDRLDRFQGLLDAADHDSTLTPIDLVDGLLAPIYLRVLLTRPSTLDDADLVRLVDNLVLIDGARRGRPGRS